MTITLALRSLLAHPVRTAVLAAGFGVGVGVMAILLGVAGVMLEQARAPVIVGGGEVLVTSATGQIAAARLLLAGPLATPPLGSQVRRASPWSRTTLYLLHNGIVTPVRARGGIPSAERAFGDPESSAIDTWTDAAPDHIWTNPQASDVLRAIDAFHPVPDVPARIDSWAEWLYFNGRASNARFYLTFLAGPPQKDGTRSAGVRLQLDRSGHVESFAEGTRLRPSDLANAPDLTIGRSHVRLIGLRYEISLDLRDERGRTATGELFIDASAQRLMPPFEIHGAGGWVSGYVVPVMGGVLGGTLVVDGERLSFDDGTGYHDHNWGFWEGVSWQWGQVQQGGTSLVYGRVFPPADAADPSRIPGFLGVIGPEGPIGFATKVTIDESSDAVTGRPRQIVIRGRGPSVDLTISFAVETMVVNRLVGALEDGMDFLQLRGRYTGSGTASGRQLRFDAPGSAETFRGRK